MAHSLDSALISTQELPLAELCAARLDGEIYAIADLYCPVDLPSFPAFRAASLLPLQSPHTFVERLSAAWLHGAIDSPPRIAQIALPSKSGNRARLSSHFIMRQVTISDREIETVGGCPVTTPLRTIVDLLLDPELAETRAIHTTIALARQFGLNPANATSALRMRFRVPHTTLAEARIERWRALSISK